MPTIRSMAFGDRKNTRQVGMVGEDIAALYLRSRGFVICARNIFRKTGEIDIVARKEKTIHIVEVKSATVQEFPLSVSNSYDPAMHIHEAKLKRLVRTGEWYISNYRWEKGWQIDAILVHIRKRDGLAQVRHIPQII